MNKIYEQALAQQILHERIRDVTDPLAKTRDAWRAFVFLAGNHALELLVEAKGHLALPKQNNLRFEPSTLVRLGIGPHTMVRADLVNDKKANGEYSPLTFAIAFLAIGVDVDTEAIPAILSYYDNREWYHATDPTQFWRDRYICPTIPEQYKGRRPLLRFGAIDEDQKFTAAANRQYLPLSSGYLGWISPGQQARAIKYVNEGSLERFHLVSRIHDGIWDKEVRKKAREVLYSDKSANPNYQALSIAVQLIDKRTFLDWLDRVKGVRQALHVVRPDATSEDMITGLRHLLSSDAAMTALAPRISRAITPDEVRELKSKTLLDLLWKAPWRVIEELARDRTTTLARLSPFLDTLDKVKVRECLTDHGERFRSIVPVTDDRWYAHAFEQVNWTDHYTKMLTAYSKACGLRDEILAETKNVYRAFLVVLPSITQESTHNIDMVLGPLSPKEQELRLTFQQRLLGHQSVDRPFLG